MFEKFIKDLEMNLASIKELGENEFEVIVSTDANDRSWESIKQDGIDIERYMQNPVVLMNHDYRVESIVWKATKVWTEGNKTYARWVFSQTNPNAKIVQDLYNEWMIKAVSIGFIPYERKDRDEIIKSEMLEFSFVAVPCNPEALSTEGKQLMKKGIEIGLIKEVDPVIEQNGDLEEEKVEEISLKDIMREIKALNEKVDAVSKAFTDDKVKEQEIADAKAKKEALQNVDKAIGDALKNIKLL